MKNPIDIKSGKLFPFQFVVLGVIFILASVLVSINYPLVALFLFIGGMFIVTSHYGVEINVSQKTYRSYNSYFFLKAGTLEKYSDVDMIFINSNKISQKMYTAHTLNSSTFRDVEYNSYLKFSSGVKVFLTSDKKKEVVLRKIQSLADALKTTVVDTTL